MLNSNHVADIRTCQRIKFDQALYILTMYEKKIRTQIKVDQSSEVLDAEKEYDEKVVRSWNGKWKMDLTKPLLNCVTSVSPRVLLDIDSQEEEMREQNDLDNYNRVFLQFVRRMRAEHEDESNFKLTEIDINQKSAKTEKFMDFASKSCSQFVSAIQRILTLMKKSVAENARHLQEIEVQDNYCCEIGSRIEDMLEVVENTSQTLLNRNLYNFVASCISIFDSIKESEHGSTLITVQPKLDEFTYLLHPLFLPIYGTFLKQKEESKGKQDKQSKEPEDASLPFRNFFGSSTSSLTKVVFINLDGYQSEFNLEFARCFRRNMLYISFPKQDIHYANDENSIYEQRLYKKVMYNWEKNKMRYDPSSNTMDEESQRADKMYFMTRNVEDYYANVEKVLYKLDNNYEDLNRNIFVFPLRLGTLNQNFNNLIPEDQDDTVDVYESYVILQIFKYFLINQIKQFGATYIVVSHSGRLNIEDSHFVQIMQELTKLSHYKIVYYPNLSTRFCPPEKRGIDHEMNINNIDYLSGRKEEGEGNISAQSNISYQFFGKVARFLKVSSGTYSLVKNFEEESILSKHTNLKVLRKANRLLQVLGNEYENIERVRFKNSEIELIPKLYQKDAEKIVKAFDKLVPLFYNELYLLLESIISVCYLPAEAKPYTILAKYGINPQIIKNNSIIQELIFFIQSKIIVRNSRNQADKQMLSLEKIKKYLECQRQKHFLEISEERYEDSVLLHFKNMRNSDIYDAVLEGRPNLSGLIDVSFANPNKESKDCLHIFDSTQVLYKLDQNQGHGPIPILIMNHLALEKKASSKFENYCAFLSRETLNKLNVAKGGEQGTQKIYEQKKVKLHLVKFYDEENREIAQNKFEFRTEWNFCETDNYIILFWPQLFNFVEAVCHRLQNRNYEPPLLNQYYLAKKQVKNDTVFFYRANVPDDLAPRSGCSTYQFRDFVYIFGGFYDRSNNYLSLQRDVTQLNLSMYTHQQHRKLQISNIKNEIYEPITKQNKQQRTPNSYVRARRQFQFYGMEDINPQFKPVEGVKSVVMLGGVGQNFIHPFSLLTYYYYQLKFNESTGRLLTINKNIVYNRSIPANIRKPSKNMGIIKTPIRNKNEANGKVIVTKPQLTQPHSYARFRIVYKMESGQLKYKFQYIFSEKDCRMLKEELRKYDEERYEVSEVSSIRIQRIDGINHMFMIEKYGSKQIVHMRLDIIDGGSEVREQQFKLTHKSVSYLNIINGSYVCALLKHPVFTNDRTILADCYVKNIENENLSEDEAPFVSLRPSFSELKGDLSLHIIQASNVNLIYILHGHRIYSSDKIFEYQVNNNKNKKTKIFTEIKPKKPVEWLVGKSVPRCCYSTFSYERQGEQFKNEIVCESYLCFEEDGNVVTKINESFNPSSTSNMCWVLKEPTARYIFCLPGSSTPLNLERIQFMEFYRKDRCRIIVVLYNKRKYLLKISETDIQLLGEEVVVRLEPTNDVYVRTVVEEEQYEKGNILCKKPQNYIDRGFYKSQ